MLSSLLLSTLAVSAAQVSAQLNKPIANPPFSWPTMSSVIHPNLTPQTVSYGKWNWGVIPQSCKTAVEADKLSPYDVEVYDVWLGDCDTKWVMCRHNQAGVSVANFFERFSRLPVGMRDHVRHVVALPCPGCLAAYASGQTGDVVFKGDVGSPSVASVWFHEVGHALDYQNGQYSTTQAWLNAYNADTAVPVAYAQTSQAENFAENMIIAAYDTLVPGGVQGMPGPQPAWWQVYNQYTQVKNGMGDKIRKIPGKRCSRKSGVSDTVVCMGPDAKNSGNCVGVAQFKIAAEEHGNNGTATPPSAEFGEVEYFDLKTGQIISHKH